MPSEMALSPRSQRLPSYTPPDSPRLAPSQRVVTVDLLEQVLAKIVQQMNQRDTDKQEATDPETSQSEDQKNQALLGRASKLEYKTVNEIWDKSNGYKIEEAADTNKIVDELDQYVFVLRKKFDKSNMDFKSYLDIKSEALRDVLREVLKDVPRQSLQNDMPTVDPCLLFHYVLDLKSFSEDQESSNSPTSMKHVDLLLGFMKDHYGSTARKFQVLAKQREISFDLLWGLYKPNDLIYTTCPGTGMPRCVRFVSAELKTSVLKGKYLNMECRYLIHDSKRFGEASIDFEIPEFSGVQKIHTLPAFPLCFHKDKETIRSRLIECGRKFVSLQGIHHQQYHGEAFYVEEEVPVKIHVSSRVMVDAASFKKANPNYRVPKIKDSYSIDFGLALFGNGISYTAASQSTIERTVSVNDMQHEDLLICSPTVLGYSLQDKQWLELAVAEVKDIEWDPIPFKHLELTPEKKMMIEALAESVGPGQDNMFDDFVRGKGQGIISLLHGPPGTGKTLTAEGISEHLRWPLYSVCAGELGTSSEVLERSLSKILRLAGHWNAVLLLDEADVFLEQRTSGLYVNNSLVSVFLRMLEYFKGIMFLTTNRLTTFDSAILSRIHFPLRFDSLDKNARMNIWINFLKKTNAQSIDAKQVERLAEKLLNGRQIRNMVRTGVALAKKGGVPLASSHLTIAIHATEEFEVDFKGHGSMESLSHYQ